jgi:hypothetical protein
MPLPVPRLDDRTFADLVREGESLIPRYGGEWTDRNASDPGVTLVELFAWLTETAIYQVDRVPPESVEAFVRLLGECPQVAGGEREKVDDALARTVRNLSVRRRAVTAAEFEALAMEAGQGAAPPVARARFLRLEDVPCAPSGGTVASGGEDAAAAVILVPDEPTSERPEPSPELVKRVFDRLNEGRILGTRIRAFGPAYVTIGVSVTVRRRRGSGLTPEQVRSEIARFLSPLEGGEDRKGWPFGRYVYRSELYQLLEGLPRVDHVESLVLLRRKPGSADEDKDKMEKVAEVAVPTYGLVHAPRAELEVAVKEVG